MTTFTGLILVYMNNISQLCTFPTHYVHSTLLPGLFLDFVGNYLGGEQSANTTIIVRSVEQRMKKALMELLRTPQNNLKIFRVSMLN